MINYKRISAINVIDIIDVFSLFYEVQELQKEFKDFEFKETFEFLINNGEKIDLRTLREAYLYKRLQIQFSHILKLDGKIRYLKKVTLEK